MTRDGACPILVTNRHVVHLTDDLQEPQNPLLSYVLLRTYNYECERMRRFIREADASRGRLQIVVEALHQMLAVAEFGALLKAEGFATMPRALAERVLSRRPNAPIAEKKSSHTVAASQQLAGGICLEVLDLLQDCSVPPKIFGLLRKVVPSRQVEIGQLMIALAKVKFNFAKTLIALTPQSQLLDPSCPRKQFAGITAAQLAVMENGLADLSQEFRSTAECLGSWGLELVAAQGYLNRLLENVRVVRYLARSFPEILSEFQRMTEPDRPSA